MTDTKTRRMKMALMFSRRHEEIERNVILEATESAPYKQLSISNGCPRLYILTRT